MGQLTATSVSQKASKHLQSLMQVFENSIYLFFTHPFDIGDEIRFEGTRYTVKSMTLQVVKLTSVFGADVTVPTAEMRNSRLHNVTRCSSMLLPGSVLCPWGCSIRCGGSWHCHLG